jgi:hypothetical protein
VAGAVALADAHAGNAMAGWSSGVNDGDNPTRCTRCGGTIDDDAEVTLIVYEADERDFDPHDPGSVLASYCETCTRVIQRKHERHDEGVQRRT